MSPSLAESYNSGVQRHIRQARTLQASRKCPMLYDRKVGIGFEALD